LIHASTVHIPILGYERTFGRDKCTGTANHTLSQPAPNPLKARCDLCYLAYHPIIKYVVCMGKCSSIKAITYRSLINPSKSNHLSSTPNMALPYLLRSESSLKVAHILFILDESCRTKHISYSSRVVVTLPPLVFYRS
jgi:hypothetical protein